LIQVRRKSPPSVVDVPLDRLRRHHVAGLEAQRLAHVVGVDPHRALDPDARDLHGGGLAPRNGRTPRVVLVPRQRVAREFLAVLERRGPAERDRLRDLVEGRRADVAHGHGDHDVARPARIELLPLVRADHDVERAAGHGERGLELLERRHGRLL
jgi:hypothetical protein